jgi:hypothetical protein
MNHIHPHACYPHYGYYGHPYYQWQYYTVPYQATYCSTCCQPIQLCQCAKPLSYMKLPQELVADSTTSTNQIFIGGSEDVSLSLEYLKTTGATSPSVKVTITEDGSSSTWDITTIPDEYQIKENFSTVSPGAEVILEVVECTARLRWCEVVCC